MRRFEVSNSSAGNAGSRRISPSSVSACGSVSRLASTEKVSCPGGTATTAAPRPPRPPRPPPPPDADADAQRIELLAEGLAIVFLRAGHHQAGEHSGRGRLALERFFVAVVQGQHERDRLTAILLGQQAGFQAILDDDLDPGIQIGGRRVEGFARGPDRAPFVILHDQVDGAERWAPPAASIPWPGYTDRPCGWASGNRLSPPG